MSNYTKTTDFAAKDSLPTGDAGKIIRGAEFGTEFDNIATAIATKADTAGPTLTGTTTFDTLSDGTIAVTAFVDEDDMSSDSATMLPTQQSVKAYVDSQTTAQDLDFEADTGGPLSIDLDSETLTLTGGTGVDTSGAGNAVTFAIDSTVATLTGTQTLTNKTLTSADIDTPDIDGGTIDGATIGGTTAAAGSFTTVSATGNITVGGTVDGRDVATDGTKLDGIEASADVTDATNVTAAGALMDSELTSIASVKALNQGVATTDSPTFAGLTTTADVSFGDNDKAIFGAGSDLEIYHSGSHSIINETGTGELKIQATNLRLQSASGAENYLTADLDGAVRIYNNDAQKLQSTSTGIDVTGTAVTDGLTVDGNILLNNEGNELQFNTSSTPVNKIYSDDTYTSNGLTISADNGVALQSTNNYLVLDDTGTNEMVLNVDGGERMRVTSTGIDVTGTIVGDGLTVDGNVGIGTSSPSDLLDISANGTSAMRLSDSSSPATYAQITQANGVLSFNADAGGAQSNSVMKFLVDNSEALRIDASGNVGIGTSPTAVSNYKVLHVQSGHASAGGYIRLQTNAATEYADIYNFNDSLYKDANTQIFRNKDGSTEYMRIDSSGNVGIGVVPASSSSPTWQHIQFGGTGNLVARKSDTTVDAMFASNYYVNASEQDSYITTGAAARMFINDNVISFDQAASGSAGSAISFSEAMRIDSSGNLLVGTTDNTVATKSTGEGFYYNDGFNLGVARSGGVTAQFNRQTNDGDIVDFRKDGTSVGSIGTTASGLVVGNGDTALFFDAAEDSVKPRNSTGAARDAAIDLGKSSHRFKDLYLSGGVYLGGTGSANHLDDYEEGTFTPTVAGDASGAFSTAEGTYTKVGRLVFIEMYVVVSTNFASNYIGGLPFTVGNLLSGTSLGQSAVVLTNAADTVTGAAVEASGNMRFFNDHSTGSSHNPNTTNGGYRLALCYQV